MIIIKEREKQRKTRKRKCEPTGEERRRRKHCIYQMEKRMLAKGGKEEKERAIKWRRKAKGVIEITAVHRRERKKRKE